MIGEQAEKHPELLAKLVAEGHHLIAHRSWDHPNFHGIDPAAQAFQVEESELALASDIKERLFRYPYGNSTCETNEYLHKAGYKIVGWHIDSCDWAFDRTRSVDPKEADICAVLPQFRNDYVGHVLSTIRAKTEQSC
jgi:peptidoglycan/xylan/chitin deacetylase (PgdA/CDA1 family)